MTKNMLIDAIHPEETRVVVTDHNQIQEFDFESQSKAPLRGNIYLAKVTRVEPSLQAAFVEYGGNRHGFLAFNEIHPDYYQIPVSDREELLKAQAAEDRSQAATDDNQADGDDNATAETDGEADGETDGDVSDIGGDAHEEAAPAINMRALHRKYKIQEVIKRRQIILIQVMKEERGNKGAALTTYLSLAGRYCVLMPNTARGGGISRKINNGADRKKLKDHCRQT
jgi:ribonuclease E